MVKPPSSPQDIHEFSQTVGATANRAPLNLFLLDNSIPFHVSRLTLLIHLAGRPVYRPTIEGRTKLAKLDFFVRYPVFLAKAIKIAGFSELIQQASSVINYSSQIEAGMLRYKYGPWDHKYYIILAYMLSKKLINIEFNNLNDNYILLEKGQILANNLMEQNEWQEIAQRCSIVGKLFEGQKGTTIKDFIYLHFPEVVHTPYSQMITTRPE